MATLGNIRNRSGLLLAVIGIAMLAFILGDLMQSTNSVGSKNIIYVGEVLGEDVLRQKFEERVDQGIKNWKEQSSSEAILDQTTISQIRDQVWNQYVKDLIMENEYEKLGIDVSDDEFFELVQGVNVHPEISKIPSFQNPESGEFERRRVLAYLKQIDEDPTGESRTRWVEFQRYLIGIMKTAKYNSLVGKAMYTTNEEAKFDFRSSTQNITFNYISIPFSSINDTDITVTDNELRNYYSDHKLEYQQESSKDVDFVVYNVIPSEEDDNNTKKEISSLISDFKIYEDYELMARRNSDNTNSKFVYATKDELKDSNFDELFDAEKGKVIGPYLFSPGVYRIAKLAELEYRPDSVEARHILIRPTQNISLDSVKKQINSLKLSIENGDDFGLIAQQKSEDQGSAIKGGDLGWFSEGTMVQEFNDLCFSSDKGKLSIVTTDYGVHLVEVTKKSKLVKKVKVVYIDRNVEPSTETFNLYYSQAAGFASQILNDGINFDTLVIKKNLVKRSDNKVTINKQNISGIPNSREMVRWLNNASVNSISEVFQFEDSYVVACVKREYKAGDIPLEDIKEQIKSLVIKDKKAEKISKSISNNLSLSEIANLNSTTVIYDKKTNFSNLNIQGIGNEPVLVGSVFANDKDVVSEPIQGSNAIFVVEVTEIDEVKLDADFSQQKLNLQRQANSYSKTASYNILKEFADVKDNRSDIY